MVRPPPTLTIDYLVDRYPRLYHMAEEGSWQSIQRHGLLSTSALLDLFGVSQPERAAIESARRSASVEICDAVHGTAWIRDNKPINETVLRRTLVGMTEAEWYRTLNRRVFFWLSTARLDRLRGAPAYRDRQHDILVLDTRLLFERHSERVELSPLNSGAVHPSANYPRGTMTFSSVVDYPWQTRVQVAPSEPIVELTVLHSVPDAGDIVLEVSTG
jgi:hypothetical protein